ncbi:hypothetical protein BKK52_00800 [Rodentibacter trehalosifermentans]|uniref:Uncharacterized protein n=1 Tax=Rodentibacter trehalosifermentans TaxID=1908263 RepID=A0A1V3J717_9PAST|nr:hypothetical protein [Rodentibacter trehalosifermentans]OOF50719.1 hypothetical protein BKK52_00800 [Rodentibacter trehalosifermentans]
MEKQKLNTKEEFDIAVKMFINRFLAENPIYDMLKLSEEQMMILVENLIMPEFKKKYDYEMKVMGRWSRG